MSHVTWYNLYHKKYSMLLDWNVEIFQLSLWYDERGTVLHISKWLSFDHKSRYLHVNDAKDWDSHAIEAKIKAISAFRLTRKKLRDSIFYLTLIRESWKKIQNAGPSPSVFCGKKIRSAALRRFVYVSVLWFFPKMTLGHGPKNGIYFCSARHISSHIGICHLKLIP